MSKGIRNAITAFVSGILCTLSWSSLFAQRKKRRDEIKTAREKLVSEVAETVAEVQRRQEYDEFIH